MTLEKDLSTLYPHQPLSHRTRWGSLRLKCLGLEIWNKLKNIISYQTNGVHTSCPSGWYSQSNKWVNIETAGTSQITFVAKWWLSCQSQNCFSFLPFLIMLLMTVLMTYCNHRLVPYTRKLMLSITKLTYVRLQSHFPCLFVCISVKCLSLIFQMLLKDVRAALFWDGTEKLIGLKNRS